MRMAINQETDATAKQRTKRRNTNYEFHPCIFKWVINYWPNAFCMQRNTNNSLWIRRCCQRANGEWEQTKCRAHDCDGRDNGDEREKIKMPAKMSSHTLAFHQNERENAETFNQFDKMFVDCWCDCKIPLPMYLVMFEWHAQFQFIRRAHETCADSVCCMQSSLLSVKTHLYTIL